MQRYRVEKYPKFYETNPIEIVFATLKASDIRQAALRELRVRFEESQEQIRVRRFRALEAWFSPDVFFSRIEGELDKDAVRAAGTLYDSHMREHELTIQTLRELNRTLTPEDLEASSPVVRVALRWAKE